MGFFSAFMKSFFPKHSPDTTPKIPFYSFDVSHLCGVVCYSLMNQLHERSCKPQFTKDDILIGLTFLDDCMEFDGEHIFVRAFFERVTAKRNYTCEDTYDCNYAMIAEAKRVGNIIATCKEIPFTKENWPEIFTYSNIRAVYVEEFSNNCNICGKRVLNVYAEEQCSKCAKEEQFKKVSTC